jgi:hypothetical protein
METHKFSPLQCGRETLISPKLGLTPRLSKKMLGDLDKRYGLGNNCQALKTSLGENYLVTLDQQPKESEWKNSSKAIL